jgi:hypothetical protein
MNVAYLALPQEPDTRTSLSRDSRRIELKTSASRLRGNFALAPFHQYALAAELLTTLGLLDSRSWLSSVR